MDRITFRQARLYRLAAHHLSRPLSRQTAPAGGESGPARNSPAAGSGWEEAARAAAGACGLADSPPGAWQNGLHLRCPGLERQEMDRLLYEEKLLTLAWSLRGMPAVFPTGEEAAFLGALRAAPGEEWIYTRGVSEALEALGLDFEAALGLVSEAAEGLRGEGVESKAALDERLAGAVSPRLDEARRQRWESPSPYGQPHRQTLGGAVCSFLLRPCAFRGQVVFGERRGRQPVFRHFEDWLGRPAALEGGEGALAKKYLHCYGPARPELLAKWLGCGPAQGARLWASAGPLAPVELEGRRAWVLERDLPALLSPPQPEEPLILASGHDPYLDQRDREVLTADRARQRALWPTVGQPGAVLWQGEAAGLWRAARKGRRVQLRFGLWQPVEKPRLEAAARAWGEFWGLEAEILYR